MVGAQVGRGDPSQLDNGVVVRRVAMRAAVGVEHHLRGVAALDEVDVALADRLLCGTGEGRLIVEDDREVDRVAVGARRVEVGDFVGHRIHPEPDADHAAPVHVHGLDEHEGVGIAAAGQRVDGGDVVDLIADDAVAAGAAHEGVPAATADELVVAAAAVDGVVAEAAAQVVPHVVAGERVVGIAADDVLDADHLGDQNAVDILHLAGAEVDRHRPEVQREPREVERVHARVGPGGDAVDHLDAEDVGHEEGRVAALDFGDLAPADRVRAGDEEGIAAVAADHDGVAGEIREERVDPAIPFGEDLRAGEDDRVVVAAALDAVEAEPVAALDRDRVVADPALQAVDARGVGDRVVADHAEDFVVAGVAEQRVVVVAAVDHVVAVAAVDRVAAAAAAEDVIVVAAVDGVVTRAAIDPVDAVVAEDRVVAAAGADDVVSDAAVDRAVAATGGDPIVSVEAEHDLGRVGRRDDVAPEGAFGENGRPVVAERRYLYAENLFVGERPVTRADGISAR